MLDLLEEVAAAPTAAYTKSRELKFRESDIEKCSQPPLGVVVFLEEDLVKRINSVLKAEV